MFNSFAGGFSHLINYSLLNNLLLSCRTTILLPTFTSHLKNIATAKKKHFKKQSTSRRQFIQRNSEFLHYGGYWRYRSGSAAKRSANRDVRSTPRSLWYNDAAAAARQNVYLNILELLKEVKVMRL